MDINFDTPGIPFSSELFRSAILAHGGMTAVSLGAPRCLPPSSQEHPVLRIKKFKNVPGVKLLRTSLFLRGRRSGQRLDQTRKADELDFRRAVGSPEAAVHVVGNGVIFPFRILSSERLDP